MFRNVSQKVATTTSVNTKFYDKNQEGLNRAIDPSIEKMFQLKYTTNLAKNAINQVEVTMKLLCQSMSYVQVLENNFLQVIAY